MSRPFRYTFILALVAIGTALAAVGGWRYARASAPVSGPIIVISVDTLRADRLPAYGYKQVRTPAIDAPVGAYYGTNTCNPAFLGFLSGWYVPFDAATLAKLYPTHDAYVTRVTASATKAVADGFMLQDDAQRLINEADASSIGKLGPTITP